jgi:hypothetical protein
MAASTQEFKIPVADDSRLYRKLVEDTLAQEQYAVGFAKNWDERSTKRYSLISILFLRRSLSLRVYEKTGGTETRWYLRLLLTPHAGIRPLVWV